MRARHEQRGRHALISHIADQDAHAIIFEFEDVIKIASHLTGRQDARAEAEFLDLPAMLAEAAARHPASLAIIDGGPEAGFGSQGERRFDHAAFDAAIDRVAHALQRAGLGPGQTVAVIAATSAE